MENKSYILCTLLRDFSIALQKRCQGFTLKIFALQLPFF